MAALIAVELLKKSCLVLVISLCLLSSLTKAQDIVNCFYTNWAQYRPEPATFDISDINPVLCSHLTYAFAKVVGNDIAPYEPSDVTQGAGYQQFNALKNINPNLTTFLSVGGYTHGPDPFSVMAATKADRTEFIQNVITYLRYWKFDGLDIDWEYVSAADKENYVFLAQEMMGAFEEEALRTGRERLQFTLSVPAGIPIIDDGYDVAALNSTVDFFNVMTYDYHGSWENNTNLHTGLRSLDDLSVTATLAHYVTSGASADKLLMGLASYARTWTLANSTEYQIGAAATGPGDAGNYTKTAGILSYYEVCQLLSAGYIQESLDPVGLVQFAHLEDQWATYENTRSLSIKLADVKRKGYGGVAFWALDFDDFSGQFCGMGKYPLLTGVYNTIYGITTTLTTTTPMTTTTMESTTTMMSSMATGTTDMMATTTMQTGTTMEVELPNIVNCFYTNWAQYRPEPATFNVSDVNPELCNHLTFAFAKVDGNDIAATEPNDDTPGGAYKQFNDLKNINPNLTTFLSVGGAGEGPDAFSAMASTQAGRSQFIQNVITYLRYWKFDGVDIAWQVVSAADRANYVALVQEMMAAFKEEAARTGRDRLMLTLSLPAGIPILEAGYDIAAVDSYVDRYNVQTYDYHGSWENETNLHTPLRAADPDTLSVEDTLLYLVSIGASSRKLLMGLATYARTWTLEDPNEYVTGVNATGPGLPGNYTQTPGILSFFEVCMLLESGYIQEPLDAAGLVQFAHLGNQWATYDNALSYRFKTDYVLRNDYGGVSYWALDYDDFSGESCGMGEYPLLNSVYYKINGITPPTTTSTTTVEPPTTTTAELTSTIDTLNISDPNCPETYKLYPDPNHCNAYYACFFNQVVHYYCGEGQMYNPDIEQCESNSNYTCTIVTTPTLTTTLPPNYPCTEMYGNFPDRNSCYRYYSCFFWEPIGVNCPSGQIFNPNSSMCEDETTSTYTC